MNSQLQLRELYLWGFLEFLMEIGKRGRFENYWMYVVEHLMGQEKCFVLGFWKCSNQVCSKVSRNELSFWQKLHTRLISGFPVILGPAKQPRGEWLSGHALGSTILFFLQLFPSFVVSSVHLGETVGGLRGPTVEVTWSVKPIVIKVSYLSTDVLLNHTDVILAIS